MANESATRYYYNTNWQVLCEKVSGATQRWYVYGNYIDEPLMMAVGTNKYYYVQDHLYSTAALVNSSGMVIERYEYDACGKPSIFSKKRTYSVSQICKVVPFGNAKNINCNFHCNSAQKT